MIIKEFIYIPFTGSTGNYLQEMEAVSLGLFHVHTKMNTGMRTLVIDCENQDLVSIIINPVYAILTKISENDLAKEIYDTLTLRTKLFAS